LVPGVLQAVERVLVDALHGVMQRLSRPAESIDCARHRRDRHTLSLRDLSGTASQMVDQDDVEPLRLKRVLQDLADRLSTSRPPVEIRVGDPLEYGDYLRAGYRPHVRRCQAI